MKKLEVYQIDAFTQELFTGNPAGVVPDADGLSAAQMQNIAAELNNSETAFILSPTADDHDCWIRYFTPTTEVPLCGHATIAAHFLLKVSGRESRARVLQKSGVGILPVEIDGSGEDITVIMAQGEIVIEKVSESLRSGALQALGLSESDLNPNCPIETVDTGHGKLIVGVRNRRILNNLRPDMRALARVSERVGMSGNLVFTFDSADDDYLTTARMFAPKIGIDEDPVTGNGNGPLGAYLVHNNLVEHDGSEFAFTGRQGEAMGRPGSVRVWVSIANGKPERVRVGGRAVIAFRGEIVL
jgi:PhzF family phenazine biosynthesis protein